MKHNISDNIIVINYDLRGAFPCQTFYIILLLSLIHISDMKNYIIDLDLGKIENPVALGEELKAMTGVVDHGLFNGMVNKVIVAGKDGVKVVEVKA